MIITEDDLKKVEEVPDTKITGYDIGVTLDKTNVVITYKNSEGKVIMQQKLTGKEARYMARELNNARSHLK
jgi:5-bromo-4-chloroindolyl phosphate hydrolysis protein